ITLPNRLSSYEHRSSVYYGYAAHRYLHSFPTRRSSDLAVGDYIAPAAERLAQSVKSVQLGRLSLGATGAWLKERQGEHSVAVNRSEEHTSELQSRENLVCRLLLEKKKAYYE